MVEYYFKIRLWPIAWKPTKRVKMINVRHKGSIPKNKRYNFLIFEVNLFYSKPID